ncbi:MAG: LPS export ABC transporter permease LptF [Gammaproteobacteria bacterium]
MFLTNRFDRYLIREVLTVTLTVCLVLLVILVSMRISRVLGQAVSGDIPPEAVLSFIFYKSTESVGLLLPLSLYLAQLLVLGRWHKDHEIDAWYACGVGMGGIYRGLFVAALPVTVLVLVFGLWISPWAVNAGAQVLESARGNTQLSGFAAGRFAESSDGRRVFYAERVNAETASMENVFVFSQGRSAERRMIASARSARLELDPDTGLRFLVLEHGHRYDGVPFQTPFRVVAFERHGVVLESIDMGHEDKREGLASAALWQEGDRESWGELQRRLFFPLIVLVLTLFALPVGSLPPRKGRYARIPVGILIYIVYANALSANGSFVDKQTVPLWLGHWWPHVPFLLLGLLLLAMHSGWLRSLLSRRRPGAVVP